MVLYLIIKSKMSMLSMLSKMSMLPTLSKTFMSKSVVSILYEKFKVDIGSMSETAIKIKSEELTICLAL